MAKYDEANQDTQASERREYSNTLTSPGKDAQQLDIQRDRVLHQPVDILTYNQVLALTEQWLLSSSSDARTKFIFAQNPEKVMAAGENPELQQVMEDAELLIPDGSGVVWALRRQGYQLPGRVTGIDLLYQLLEQAQQLGVGVFFLGGKDQVVSEACRRLNKDFPDLNIVGYHHGYFSDETTHKIIEQINNSGAQLLFTALGSPKQELFLTEHRDDIDAQIAMGIGGSLDVIAGQVKRAPRIFQALKLEWFYRVMTDPKRAGRVFQIPKFISRVILQRGQEK